MINFEQNFQLSDFLQNFGDNLNLSRQSSNNTCFSDSSVNLFSLNYSENNFGKNIDLQKQLGENKLFQNCEDSFNCQYIKEHQDQQNEDIEVTIKSNQLGINSTVFLKNQQELQNIQQYLKQKIHCKKNIYSFKIISKEYNEICESYEIQFEPVFNEQFEDEMKIIDEEEEDEYGITQPQQNQFNNIENFQDKFAYFQDDILFNIQSLQKQ
ncbi:hypothetical protein PPERSA_02309 [Pseudocohnilembus persalinus]|uniref:Uncharacterized protein n=1 Tax=Pseudocohnilembus persalinus TaxID=266149 RepID=A0A0V0QU84_PSEPJ|nr:hypothetical protein PPERSA_02309 [Pseudocohnilembus persalinus]|eukprot:KRX05777.1 hypothetical protein PPERSA_02309 [Pseudocohnilembus persalinus]